MNATTYPSEREEKRQVLLDAVERVHETLAAHADEAESQGTPPSASVDALVEAGLFRLKLPRSLGGAEADPATYLEVIEALAIIDSSAAWCTMVGATGIGLIGAFLPDEAIAEVFKDGRVPLAAGVAMPAGKATAVEGGFRLSGQWPFASGIRHSEWLMGGGLLPAGDDRPPVYRMFVFPTEIVEIIDNWQVAGLEGTGSCDFVLPESFVPEAFSWEMAKASPRRGGPLHQIGAPGFQAMDHAAFALGIARRALDTVIETAGTKLRGPGEAPSSVALRPVFQRALGESDMRLRAARALTFEVFEEGWAQVSQGRPVEPKLLADMRGVTAFSTAVAADVTTQAFRYSGGSALYRGNILQRLLRDVNGAAQHIIVSDSAYENVGQFALGIPGASPRS